MAQVSIYADVYPQFEKFLNEFASAIGADSIVVRYDNDVNDTVSVSIQWPQKEMQLDIEALKSLIINQAQTVDKEIFLYYVHLYRSLIWIDWLISDLDNAFVLGTVFLSQEIHNTYSDYDGFVTIHFLKKDKKELDLVSIRETIKDIILEDFVLDYIATINLENFFLDKKWKNLDSPFKKYIDLEPKKILERVEAELVSEIAFHYLEPKKHYSKWEKLALFILLENGHISEENAALFGVDLLEEYESADWWYDWTARWDNDAFWNNNLPHDKNKELDKIRKYTELMDYSP